MAKKNKLWFSGEDAQLAARFTKCLRRRLYTIVVHPTCARKRRRLPTRFLLRNVPRRWIKCIPMTRPVEEIVESKLMWESIRKYLHKLTPKECEVMISLYVEQLSVSDTVAKLGVEKNTVSTHRHNACEKIRKEMEEN